MQWLFQVLALTSSLYGCQVWATSSLTYDYSKITLHTSFILASRKTPGCQERYWYSLRAPQNRSDALFFLLVQMHHTILEQFTLFKQSTSWESCAGWPSSCRQKWYMDLSGSAGGPIISCVSAIFGCRTISRVYQSETVRAHCANISSGAGESLTIWHHINSPFQQIYEDLSQTFWCAFGDCSWLIGWQKKKSQACVASLPSLRYFQQSQPCTFLPSNSPFWLSGHIFLVQRMRHNRNGRPYELRICDKRDWHTVQDEEHILLDCPHEHLVSLCTQYRQLDFSPQYENSPTRLRTFLNQPDMCGHLVWHLKTKRSILDSQIIRVPYVHVLTTPTCK